MGSCWNRVTVPGVAMISFSALLAYLSSIPRNTERNWGNVTIWLLPLGTRFGWIRGRYPFRFSVRIYGWLAVWALANCCYDSEKKRSGLLSFPGNCFYLGNSIWACLSEVDLALFCPQVFFLIYKKNRVLKIQGMFLFVSSLCLWKIITEKCRLCRQHPNFYNFSISKSNIQHPTP